MLDVRDRLPEHDLLEIGLVRDAEDRRGTLHDGDMALTPAQGDAARRELTVRGGLQARDEFCASPPTNTRTNLY